MAASASAMTQDTASAVIDATDALPLLEPVEGDQQQPSSTPASLSDSAAAATATVGGKTGTAKSGAQPQKKDDKKAEVVKPPVKSATAAVNNPPPPPDDAEEDDESAAAAAALKTREEAISKMVAEQERQRRRAAEAKAAAAEHERLTKVERERQRAELEARIEAEAAESKRKADDAASTIAAAAVTPTPSSSAPITAAATSSSETPALSSAPTAVATPASSSPITTTASTAKSEEEKRREELAESKRKANEAEAAEVKRKADEAAIEAEIEAETKRKADAAAALRASSGDNGGEEKSLMDRGNFSSTRYNVGTKKRLVQSFAQALDPVPLATSLAALTYANYAKEDADNNMGTKFVYAFLPFVIPLYLMLLMRTARMWANTNAQGNLKLSNHKTAEGKTRSGKYGHWAPVVITTALSFVFAGVYAAVKNPYDFIVHPDNSGAFNNGTDPFGNGTDASYSLGTNDNTYQLLDLNHNQAASVLAVTSTVISVSIYYTAETLLHAYRGFGRNPISFIKNEVQQTWQQYSVNDAVNFAQTMIFTLFMREIFILAGQAALVSNWYFLPLAFALQYAADMAANYFTTRETPLDNLVARSVGAGYQSISAAAPASGDTHNVGVVAAPSGKQILKAAAPSVLRWTAFAGLITGLCAIFAKFELFNNQNGLVNEDFSAERRDLTMMATIFAVAATVVNVPYLMWKHSKACFDPAFTCPTPSKPDCSKVSTMFSNLKEKCKPGVLRAEQMVMMASAVSLTTAGGGSNPADTTPRIDADVAAAAAASGSLTSSTSAPVPPSRRNSKS